ncbi:MAG: thioether cross-link-forming SCIFF peptide maturase [Selenomonadaceae bacterium]|nr:thioether cross-link-forming SCIFF peptide maturase [Selenomonadaceae bacterium]
MIHKFKQGDDFILLDVESGAVHLVDELTFEILDDFDGINDAQVVDKLKSKYPAEEISEVLDELHQLIDAGELFAPEIDEVPTFASRGVVKSLCLMVAQDCNLRCKYCFGDAGTFGHRAVMSETVGRAAVDFIIKNSGIRKHCEIDFFGGEPLLNFRTVKAVTEYVRQRERDTGKIFKLTLTTNGMLLDEKISAWLDDNNISLVLSLDGRREVHDAMRPDIGGRGSYDRVLKNFQRVVKARGGENYYLRGTYTKRNLDFTADVENICDAGFDIVSVEPVVLKDSPLALTVDDLPRIRDEYDRLTEFYLERHRNGRGFNFFHFNVDLSNGPCVAKRLSGCGAGHEYFAVAENGDLYPCHQFVGRERYKLGNIFDGVSESARHWPKYFRESHVLNKPKCRSCWAKFFCSGGCHANADLFHGDIRQPYEVGCEIQKKRLECAIYVQAKLLTE